jgi:hypothetical protein
MRISVFVNAKQAVWNGLLLVAASGLTPVATAGETPPGQPDRLPVASRRSHIQPIGEMRKPQPADQVAAAGLQLSRAPEILRRQLALVHGEGLVVDAVAAQSAAAQIGIQPHDVLVRLGDQLLVLPEQLAVLLETIPFSSSEVSISGHATDDVLTILRAGQPLRIPLGRPATGPVAAVSMPRPKLEPTLPSVARPNGPPKVAVPSANDPRVDRQAASAPPAAAETAMPAQNPVTSTPPRRPFRQPDSAIQLAAGDQTISRGDAEEAVLLREDDDFTIRLGQAADTRLTVLTPAGHRVFDGCIDTPERLATVPPVLRPRVDAMLRVLGPRPPAAGPGELLSVPPVAISP